VIQRLHPVFGAAVNEDLDAVTSHLAARGMETPRLVRTLAGDACVTEDGGVWRALTWVDGETHHRIGDPAMAEAGGELVGAFHRAVADLQYDYAFARAGVHDTAMHLARLREHAAAHVDDAAAVEWKALAREILDAAETLPPLPVDGVPRRHCHGDLKLSNLMFRGARGVALLDLDTLGKQTLTFELGDAMRSWCNPSGEDAGRAAFDLAIFERAMRGFRAVAGAVVAPAELRAVVAGLEVVCLELAARFCVDVFRDDYFGWDASRFPSRRAHNLVRARGQLALGRSVRAARADVLAIVS
jgi:Ser/Thr protein kinase RdoA (MazF antagonist)